MPDPVAPSEQQRQVIEAAPADRLLVTAAAGTGKTFALVQRLTWLVETKGMRPGRDLLVLSFSRAAVRELRNRLRGETSPAAYVHSTTLDSFATRTLSEFDFNGSWLHENYDGRILCLLDLLRNSHEALLSSCVGR
jgi:superfamily I DNA/RNA helicase